MTKLGGFQLAVMTILFELGSTPLFELGIKAKQDAWLAMTVAALLGFVLLWVYLRLQRRTPDAGLAEALNRHFGRWPGKAAALLFAVYFAYESVRNVRDFSELTILTILSQTPQWIIILIVSYISYYAVRKGTEVVFRVMELLFPIVAVSYAFLVILLLAAKLPNIHNLRPMLENGFGPVWHAAFPDLVSFPFGQTVVFLVFWHYAKERRTIRKASYLGYVIVAVLLVFMNAFTMMVLGPEIAGMSSFPLLEAVQLIRLANFLERLDIFVTLLLYIGLYVKITLFYLAAVLTVKAVFGASHTPVALTLIALIAAASYLEPNYTAHIWIGLSVVVKIYPAIQIGIPLLMLVVGALRGIGREGTGRQKQGGGTAQ